jgi:hypothetical protein
VLGQTLWFKFDWSQEALAVIEMIVRPSSSSIAGAVVQGKDLGSSMGFAASSPLLNWSPQERQQKRWWSLFVVQSVFAELQCHV